MELRGLNDRQLEAVKATEGRVRIIAGAGEEVHRADRHRKDPFTGYEHQ